MTWQLILGYLSLAALIAVVIIWRKSKGKRGEKQVAVLLGLLSKKKYKVINDLLLQSGAYSTQIDHVVVSVYGVFVIETKYMQGWIYGGENSEFWTQNIYGHKYQLRNPLWQNQGHVRAISRLIGSQDNIPIHNIVAFSKQATLKIDRSLPVMYWWRVVPFIKRFKQPIISEARADEIYEKLLASNVTDRKARKEHVVNVYRNQTRRNYNVANGRCPRCGGELVLRNGMYGQFYGCSNYPNCKYILDK